MFYYDLCSYCHHLLSFLNYDGIINVYHWGNKETQNFQSVIYQYSALELCNSEVAISRGLIRRRQKNIQVLKSTCIYK